MLGRVVVRNVDLAARAVVEPVEWIAEERPAFLDRHHVDAGQGEIAVGQRIEPDHGIAADVLIPVEAPFAPFGDDIAGHLGTPGQALQRGQRLFGLARIALPVDRGIGQPRQEQRQRCEHDPAGGAPGQAQAADHQPGRDHPRIDQVPAEDVARQDQRGDQHHQRRPAQLAVPLLERQRAQQQHADADRHGIVDPLHRAAHRLFPDRPLVELRGRAIAGRLAGVVVEDQRQERQEQRPGGHESAPRLVLRPFIAEHQDAQDPPAGHVAQPDEYPDRHEQRRAPPLAVKQHPQRESEQGGGLGQPEIEEAEDRRGRPDESQRQHRGHADPPSHGPFRRQQRPGGKRRDDRGNDPAGSFETEEPAERHDQDIGTEVAHPAPLKAVVFLKERALIPRQHDVHPREVGGIVDHLRIGGDQHRQG